MHEVGIISSMLKTVESVMEAENLTTVEEIVLDVGELSGVVPHYMQECFPAATYKTRFVNTRLKMNIIPGIVKCDKCGCEFNAVDNELKCPDCGEDKHHTPKTGTELIIKEIHGN